MPPSKDWIQCFTGGKFFPLQPEIEAIHFADIARALSMQCRYAGHVARFYSVAEHSVRIARRVLELDHDAPPDLLLWALLHDASEAYLGDVTRPVKHQPEFAGYRTAEKHLQAMIAARFGLPPEEPEIVRQLDTEILGTEARQLKAPVHPDWGKTTATGELPAAWDVGPLGWFPHVAEAVFRETAVLIDLLRGTPPEWTDKHHEIARACFRVAWDSLARVHP